MLQIDHIYEFLYQELFKEFDVYHHNGIVNATTVLLSDIIIFTHGIGTTKKIFFYDQEPLLEQITDRYLDIFEFPNKYSADELLALLINDSLPFGLAPVPNDIVMQHYAFYKNNLDSFHKQLCIVISEKSALANIYASKYNTKLLYYFFHGFAALDWYRGYYALNYSKLVITNYKHDFISFNRIITDDRSYRIYFVSKLKELGLLEHGLVSFNVTDNVFDDWREETASPNSKLSESAKQHIEHHMVNVDKLVIDSHELPGSASADIPRTINSWIHPDCKTPVDVTSFWHIVTETVFYYDKLHLTEKIFKPIVSKQPFMLLAAPGNLAYLKSYGFKTFDSVIDESYDDIQDNDLRIEAVVKQLQWYCALSAEEKQAVIERLAPIVEYNFHHFYGEFKHIITKELLDNCKTLFKEVDYDDSGVAYDDIYKVLTN